VYNVPVEYLDPCLSALSRQTFRSNEFEIVIVDDASTEQSTLLSLDRFAAKNSNARVVRHERNLGLNEARRTGAHHAVGDYVVYVDGDDILARDGAERLWLTAIGEDADLVTAPLRRWYPNKSAFDRYPSSERAWPQGIDRYKAVVDGERSYTMCGRAIRRTLLTDEVFDLPLKSHHEDMITWARLVFAAQKISHFRLPVYYYSTRDGALTSTFTESHLEGRFDSLKEWAALAKDAGVTEEVFVDGQRGAERTVAHLLDRVLADDSRTLDERMALAYHIRSEYRSLDFFNPAPSRPATKLLALLEGGPGDAALVSDYIAGPVAKATAKRLLAQKPEFGMVPSDTALVTKDKVVFICQVDHHLRNAAKFARELRKRGHACVILDNSGVTANGRRQLASDEASLFWRTRRIRVGKLPYDVDWLSTAKFVVTFNDFNDDFREALEFRHLLGLPTAGMIEGINDFLRLDFDTPRVLPYRRCDYVFMAGQDDAQYFSDRATRLIGLPKIEELAAVEPVFPETLTAALNVNFTYGCLEDKRELFVDEAVEAIKRAGFRLRVTQHPMDNGDLSSLPVTGMSQYDLIESSSVFVSRFATGILEALAMGKPVIYFNPHGERVAKFTNPLGAFEVATTAGELGEALGRVQADIAAGVDFKARSSEFMRVHTGLGAGDSDASARCTEAVAKICDETFATQVNSSRLLIECTGWLVPVTAGSANVVFGAFDREAHAQILEEEAIGRYFEAGGKLMVDVGANFGNSLDVFLGRGWEIHAFEPDPSNRAVLLDTYPNEPRLSVSSQAVSEKSGSILPFYASDESTGISSLAAFTEGHRQVATVTTITLDDYLGEKGIGHVDFLKVDVEGFDKFVLDGFPWDRDRPDVVLVEFEDFKTVPLGYTTNDLASILQGYGYTVYASIWHPILRYGVAHDWSSLERYRSDLPLAETWGNLIAFREPPSEDRLRETFETSLKFVPAKATSEKPVGEVTPASNVAVKHSSKSSRAKRKQLIRPALGLAQRRWPLSLLAVAIIGACLVVAVVGAGSRLSVVALLVGLLAITGLLVGAALVIVRKASRAAGRRLRNENAALKTEIQQLEQRLLAVERWQKSVRPDSRINELRSDLELIASPDQKQ